MTGKYVCDLAGGIALYDVVADLPQHPHRRYALRPESAILRQYHHHSGALGPDGFEGAAASARFVVEHRGWPGSGYHVWIPYRPERDDEGRMVVYLCQHWWTRSYHTGGGACNTHGIGVAWQGNLREREPSDAQIEIAEALVPWLQDRFRAYGPDSITWHSEAGRWGGSSKPACPGPHVEAWLSAWRDDQRWRTT